MSGVRHVWGASLMSGAFGQCDSRHTIIHVCVYRREGLSQLASTGCMYT